MAQLISELWEGLRNAGLPEVMLYLADNSASRCHWDDTTLVNGVRVALLADQERQIVRILPVDSCLGIGIASPKGVDPSGYKRFVFNKLTNGDDTDDEEEIVEDFPNHETVIDVTPAPPPPPVAQTLPPPAAAPSPPPKPDPLASRFGVAMRPATPNRFGSSSSFGAR